MERLLAGEGKKTASPKPVKEAGSRPLSLARLRTHNLHCICDSQSLHTMECYRFGRFHFEKTKSRSELVARGV